jgi:hypothetical protein
MLAGQALSQDRISFIATARPCRLFAITSSWSGVSEDTPIVPTSWASTTIGTRGCYGGTLAIIDPILQRSTFPVEERPPSGLCLAQARHRRRRL